MLALVVPIGHTTGMKLKQYLSEQGISYTEFARSIGVTPSTVSRFCSDVRRPSLDTVLVITRATGGAVNAESFSPEIGEAAE